MCRPDSSSRKKRVNLSELKEDMARVRYIFGTNYLQRLIDGVQVVKYYKGADDKTRSENPREKNPILLEDEHETEEILL